MTDAVPSYDDLLFAYVREKKARRESERVLQTQTRRMYTINEELNRVNSHLRQHQRMAIQQEKLAALGTLVAGMAHEINNPLAFAMGNLQTLAEYTQIFATIITQARKQALTDADIDSQVNRILPRKNWHDLWRDTQEVLNETELGLTRVKEIVADLKSFSRQEDRDFILQDINRCIHSALNIFNNEFKNSCEVTLALGELPSIYCNPTTMTQIFINLLSNAKQALIPGQLGHIGIHSELLHDEICVSLSDDGCGMSEHTQNNMFVPFFTTKPYGTGTGLGLAIIHEKIKDMGGRITCTSSEGQGSCFYVYFPLERRNRPRRDLPLLNTDNEQNIL